MLYLEKCEICGACHWQASKSQRKKNSEGTFTLRYRTCKECGNKIQTIQWDGLNETKYKATKQRNGKHGVDPKNVGMRKFLNEVMQDEKPTLKLKIDLPKRDKVVVEHDGVIYEDNCPTEEEALEIIRKWLNNEEE